MLRQPGDKKSNLYSQGVSYLEVQKIEKNINEHDHTRMPIRPGTLLSASGEEPHPFPITLKAGSVITTFLRTRTFRFKEYVFFPIQYDSRAWALYLPFTDKGETTHDTAETQHVWELC